MPFFKLCLLIGAAATVLAIPLILRIVPPNYVYGVRTRATLADRTLWYRANRVGGALLLAWGTYLLVLSWVFRNTPIFGSANQHALGTAAIVLPLLVVVMLTLRSIRR